MLWKEKEEKKEENVEEPIRKSGKKRTTKSKKHKHKKKEKTIDQPQAPGKRKSTKKHSHGKSLPDNNENNNMGYCWSRKISFNGFKCMQKSSGYSSCI